MADDDIVQNVRVNVEADSADGAFDQLKQSLQSAFDALKQAFSDFDFGAAWDKIKEAGAKAFEALRSAGTDSLKSLAEAAVANSEAIGNAVIAIGAAVAGLGVALGVAAKAMFSFVESTSQAVNAMGELADKTQTSIKELSSMQSFFANAGVGPQEFEKAYSHLSQSVAEAWTSIKKEVTEGTDKVGQAHLQAAQAALRLQEAQRNLKNVGQDLAKQERDDANSVVDAQRRLAEAQIAKDKSLGLDTSRREKDLATQKLDIDLARAKQGVQDAQIKQASDAAKEQDEIAKRQLAVKQAQLAADQAQRSSRNADRNDLGNITRSVQSLASGNQDALRNFNASADNILKGIVASAAESGAAIKELGVDFSGLSDTGPKVKDVLLQLGLVLNNINDPILRNQVAFKALGNASQDFINALKTGGIDDFIDKMGKLGGAVSDADKKVASDFNNSLTRLQDTLGNIGVKISTAFGPAFTAALDNINSAFDRSRDNIVRFAESIASVVGPPVRALSAIFNALAQTLNTIIDITRNVREAIKSAFGLSDIPLTKTLENLYNILKAIAKIITGDLKGGIEDLKKQSAKELADTFKGGDDKKTGRGADGFPIGTTQAQKDLVNYRAQQQEDAAARSRGLNPAAQQQQSLFDRLKSFFTPTTDKPSLPQPGAPRVRDGQTEFPRGLTQEQRDRINFNAQRQEDEAARQRALVPPAPGTPPGQSPAIGAAQSSILDTLTSSFTSIADKLKQNIDSHFQTQPSQPAPGTPPAAAPQQPAPGQPPQPAAPPQPDQSSSILQDFFSRISSFLSNPNTAGQPATPDNSAGMGIRGSLDDASSGLEKVASAADAPVSPLQQLAAEAGNAASQLASIKVTQSASAANTGGDTATVKAAEGGHVRGPGTSTSDSIDAKLSDGEYVLRKTAVDAVGVPWLNWLNRQIRGFAAGGQVVSQSPVTGQVGETLANSSTLGPGPHEITYDPDTGGAYIDGILHTPPDPILNDPVVKKGIEESKQGAAQLDKQNAAIANGTYRPSSHPDGYYAKGGLVRRFFAHGGPVWGEGTATSDSIPALLSNEEFVQPARATRHYGMRFMEAIRTLQFPRFALGGLVSPSMPRFAVGGPVTVDQVGGGGSPMPHLGSVDLSTNFGTTRVYADRDAIGDLRKAAVKKNMGSSKKSSWVG